MTRSLAALLALVPAAAQAQSVTIHSPGNDTVVRPGTMTVSGSSSAPVGTLVTLRVGPMTYTPAVQAGGGWEQLVDVPPTTQEWTATAGGPAAAVLISPGTDLPPARPVQEVCLVWDPGTADELWKMPMTTLTPPPPAGQKAGFVAGVQAQVETAFTRAYTPNGVGLGVRLVAAPGPGVHVIRFVPAGGFGSDYGTSPQDFGNSFPGEVSRVLVGTFAWAMENEFRHHVYGWQPMEKFDDLAMRLDDVAEALGRTAAHELAHSLGLVAAGLPGVAGEWMKGTPDNHNNPGLVFTPTHRLADRHKSGRYLMDPGSDTRPFTRIAEPTPGGRLGYRQPAWFNGFNVSYLRLIQP